MLVRMYMLDVRIAIIVKTDGTPTQPIHSVTARVGMNDASCFVSVTFHNCLVSLFVLGRISANVMLIFLLLVQSS